MEVTALCITLMVEVLVLLVVNHGYLAQKTAFPRVHPDRLQFFEYETVRVDCEEFGGLTEWRVMTKLHKSPKNSYWNSAPSCTIYPVFERNSGEFWCEDEGGNTSAAVNIAVTAGLVILEVPARPVVEGHDVTLHCRKKETQTKHIVDFYKDGSRLGTFYEKNLMIQNVSKSHEGFYKCSISGAGHSPQSWLTVLQQDNAADEDTDRPLGLSPDPPYLLWVGVGVLVVALLLLVMGLLLCRKHRVSACLSCGKPTSHSPGDHTVSGGHRAGNPDLVIYAAVRSQKKKKKGTKSRRPEESVVYSSVHYR